MLISLSAPVISSSPWSSAGIVCGILKPPGIWKSCHDWRSLKQLLPCSSKTGVSLYLAYPLFAAHTADIHQAIFCFCQPPPPPLLSPIHFISLHPILCLWAEGCDSVPARLLLWRLHDHLSLRGARGHPRQSAYCWRYSHHWTNGETLIKLAVYLCCAVTEHFLALFFLFVSDCTGWMLPGPILWRALTGLHSKPLCVLPVQGARKLPVWLLRGPVAHQYGKAKRGTPAAQFPICL